MSYSQLTRGAQVTLLAILTAQLGLGCSTSATIYTRNGGVRSGSIEHSSADTLYLQNDDVGEWRVRHDDIERIRHPGLGWAVFGALFTSLGVGLTIAGATTDCASSKSTKMGPQYGVWDLNLDGVDWLDWGNVDACDVLVPFGVTAMLIGLGPMIWGSVTYAKSRARARPPEPLELSVAPTALTDGEDVYYGGGLTLRW